VPMYWNSFTYYEDFVSNRVEKYFFDTPSTDQTVDKSTFIEGGGRYEWHRKQLLKKYGINT
ncbi:hypothetical protein, partial [Bacillus timonensis]|uniref:hypothetical protein n=1 Tax=Bacillus timonensis TaxID=1033734 RepID=UPI001A93FE38